MNFQTSAPTQRPDRHLVLLEQKPFKAHQDDIRKKFHKECVSACSLATRDAKRDASNALVLEKLGIGVFDLPRKQLEDQYGEENVISDLRLERPATLTTADGTAAETGSCEFDERHDTWGRQVVHASAGAPTGRGIKVCVVDTGLDVTHKDFRKFSTPALQERLIGFSDDNSTDDVDGHGTHCAGIICGTVDPNTGARYGVAPDVDLFVANVFGLGTVTFVSRVVEAVEWAITQKCHIVSMSLQRPVLMQDGTKLDQKEIDKFEAVALRALGKDVMLVASTGNASDRKSRQVVEASFPACCDSVLAVGGVNKCRHILNSSNGGAEVLGPASAIFSAVPRDKYTLMTGTSMAAAFVSGVAALHAEADASLRGEKLLNKLKNGGSPRRTKLVKAP